MQRCMNLFIIVRLCHRKSCFWLSFLDEEAADVRDEAGGEEEDKAGEPYSALTSNFNF